MKDGFTPAARQLLVINPNANPEVTARIRQAALPLTGPNAEVTAVNPLQGPFAIESAADRQAAIPHVLSLVAAAMHLRSYEGYILACFDDIGTEEIRALTKCPVVSLAEAAIRETALHHRRFAIVTTVESAVSDIEALIRKYRISGCCSIRPTGRGVTETTSQTREAEAILIETLCKLRDDEGAEAIVLGSAAYAGRGQQLSKQIGIPVIDGLSAAMRFCKRAWRETAE